MANLCRLFAVLLCLLSLLVPCFYAVTSERTKEKIYIDITSKNGCFRLLNATHQIGCSSSLEGNTGVVHYMQTEKDFDYVLKKGTTGPYVPILHPVDFTIANVRRLAHSGHVSGIAVLNVNLTDKDLDGFSADKSCPNDAYGLYHGTELQGCKRVKWNPAGDGLFFDDIGVPIFSITQQSDADTIIHKCWDRFNKPLGGQPRTYPLCAMQLKAVMIAAKSSVTCTRRSNMATNLSPITYCDPLGDKNIIATLKAVPSNQTRPEKSVILVATRMDVLGMFYNEFPGADSTVTGIVTLLATAKALWRLRDDIENVKSSKDIMFSFFQGEAFDYIGSSSMLYEMEKGRFPVDFKKSDSNINLQKINLTHISQFVELSQVGMRQDEDSLWLHVDPKVQKETQVQQLLQKLTDLGTQSNTTFKSPSATNPLPPASLQRFLKEKSPIESFVITDHQESFTNKFYNSHRDLPGQIKADYPSGVKTPKQYNTTTVQSQRITSLATALARYLFWAATGNMTVSQSTRLQADIDDVNHMLYCFLHSPHCELFNFTISPDNADALNKNKMPFPFYVSVGYSTNQVTYLTQGVLAYFTGQVVPNVTQDACDAQGTDQRYKYMWMQGPIASPDGKRTPLCYRSTVRLSKAQSPAFEIDGYDWKSGQYPTWTESRWEEFTVRVFLIPSKQFQVLILTIGVAFLVISLVAVYFINSSSDVLFQNSADEHEREHEREREQST